MEGGEGRLRPEKDGGGLRRLADAGEGRRKHQKAERRWRRMEDADKAGEGLRRSRKDG